MKFFPSDLLQQLCHRTFGTSKRGGWIFFLGGELRVLELLVGFAQLHSPSPSLDPKYGSHLKAFVCREGGWGLGREGDRRVGGGWGGPDLFEQSGCNESSLGSLEVEGQSERRGTGEWGEIQLQTDCWT